MKEKSRHLLSQKMPKRDHHEKALGNNLKLTTNNQRQLRGPRSDSPPPPAQLANMSAYSVKRGVSFLREKEIGKRQYSAEICLQKIRFEKGGQQDSRNCVS